MDCQARKHCSYATCLIILLQICAYFIGKVDTVHGQHYIRKTNQQKVMDTDTELEEELDAEAEEEDLMDRIIALSSNDWSSPTAPSVPYRQKHRQQKQEQQRQEDVFEQGETRDFLNFLRRIHYDHRQCPQNGGRPVQILVSVVVSNVRAVSEVTMDYSLEMFYRESWQDERLRYDIGEFRNKTELALHESYANFLWRPDTFMPNAIASKNPRKQSISHRSLLRLQSDGQILYSRRLSVVAECPMDLTLFPFDSQTCKLGIESYGYTSDKVHYGWSQGQRAALKLHRIRLPDFRINEAFVTAQEENYATGNYSRLYVCFVFSRSAGFCFLQLIIPSTAVVITSWVSLWMENETSFQDMISIILTITFLLFSYNEVMPRVSYLKALDIWLAVCFMIVFLSLIKLAIMKYMRQRLKLETSAQENSLLAGILPLVQMHQQQQQQNQYNIPPVHQQSQSQSHPQQPIFPFGIYQQANSNNGLLMTMNNNIPPIGGGPLAGAAGGWTPAAAAALQQRRPPTPPQQILGGGGIELQTHNTLSRRLLHLQHQNDQEQEQQQDHQREGANGGRRRGRSPSAATSSTIGDNDEAQRRRSTLSSGLGTLLASGVPQLLAQHHPATTSSRRRKGSGGGSSSALAPYQIPISTLAATSLNLPLSQSSLRQLQQQQLYQFQQQLHFQAHLQQTQLLHQAQLQALEEERKRERQRRRERELRKRQRQLERNTMLLDTNQNQIGTAFGSRHRSPVTAIRIGIESTSNSGSSSEASGGDNNNNTDDEGGHRPNAVPEKRLFFCFDQFGNVEFSAQFMRRFHWVSQMSFFFGFVLFCLYFFLVYPNSRSTATDPACRREDAEWFASIPSN